MITIKVESVSPEEALHGIAEFWAGGVLIAYTIYGDDGDLMLRIEPSRGPVMISMRAWTDALVEAERLLSLH